MKRVSRLKSYNFLDIGVKIKIAVFFVAVLAPLVALSGMNSNNYSIDSDSFNMGGGVSTSTSYTIFDSLGEVAAQVSSSTNYLVEPFIGGTLFRYLSVTTPASASFVGKTVSTSAQTAIGSIAPVQAIDDGTVGWSLTLYTTHFTSLGSTSLLAGANNTVSFTGTYDGLDGALDPNGTFIVEITTGGAVGVAVFKWTDPAGNVITTITTASSVLLSNGVTVVFTPATYVAGDKWSVGVDVFPYTGLTVTPSTVAVVTGDSGVFAGSQELLTGSGATSDPKTLMIGAANNSTGTYNQNEDLELNIHTNSLQGVFNAQATLTII